MGWEGVPPRTLIPPPSPKKPVLVAFLQAGAWPKVKKEKEGGCLRAHHEERGRKGDALGNGEKPEWLTKLEFDSSTSVAFHSEDSCLLSWTLASHL